MDGKPLFYYFGDDEAYFRALIGEFNNNSKVKVEFKRFFESEEAKIQSFFLSVFLDRPSCIFIDFSKNSQDYLHLARIIARTNLHQPIIMVGLVDYLSPPEVLAESIATGVNLSFIKSAETFDVLYNVLKLFAPNEVSEHGFATASLNDEVDASMLVKVGYIHQNGLHFETDFPLKQGDRRRILHHWMEKKVVPSAEMFIQNVSQANLFYHFGTAVDAEFLFIDEFLPPEGMEEQKIVQRKKDREDLIKYHKKQLHNWIKENIHNSLEKKAKVLVIDRNFHFYKDQLRTDRHPYTIRCAQYLKDMGLVLSRLEPQVIAYALEPEDAKEPKNTNENLVQLVNTLREKFPDNPPFLIIFNCKVSTNEMRLNFQYQNILTYTGELLVEVLVRMAEIFDKKLEKSIPKVKGEDRVFLKKTNKASLAEIVIPIKIIKLSETDLLFQSEQELPIGKNIRVRNPVDMFINIQPAKAQGKVPEYYGLIHAIGEEEKKSLRKFVNSVFFRDHDAQLLAEKQEFENLNEAKLQERLEAEKAAKEAAEKQAQEDSGHKGSEQEPKTT